jgi:hypothetical protein
MHNRDKKSYAYFTYSQNILFLKHFEKPEIDKNASTSPPLCPRGKGLQQALVQTGPNFIGRNQPVQPAQVGFRAPHKDVKIARNR